MNLRTASLISLCTMPAAWLLLQAAGSPATTDIALAIVAGGLFLAIVTCIRSARAGDRGSRNRSIGGIVLNGLYLALILYFLLVIIPDMRRLALKLQEENLAQQKREQEAQTSGTAAPQQPLISIPLPPQQPNPQTIPAQ